MLQLLVFADVHTFTDNIRLALNASDRTDAILIAGDLEAEEEALREAAGDIPCFAVCGNNDHYLNTKYPEELLIDISSPSSIQSPSITNVSALHYDTLPGRFQALPAIFHDPSSPVSRLLRKFVPQKRPRDICHRILVTHGHKYGVPHPDSRRLADRAALWDADLVIFGHTHRFADKYENSGRCRILNPGCLLGDPQSTYRALATFEICSYAVLRIGFDGEVSFQQRILDRVSM